jgi:phosphoserine aminotransferase
MSACHQLSAGKTGQRVWGKWRVAPSAGAWVRQSGGLAAMAEHNRAKAALLYDYLDLSALYRNPVARADRSLMNVPFKLKDEALDDAFLKGAQARGMVQLKGHRSVGGMRASIYNAMPLEGVQRLVSYMKDFEAKHG